MSPTNHAPARLTRVFPSTARVKPRQDAPRAMTRSHYLTMAFHESLDVAQNLALRDMLRWMRRVTGLRVVDLYRMRFGSGLFFGVVLFVPPHRPPTPPPPPLEKSDRGPFLPAQLARRGHVGHASREREEGRAPRVSAPVRFFFLFFFLFARACLSTSFDRRETSN